MDKHEKLYKITANSFEKYLLLCNWIRDYNFPNKKMMVFHEGDQTIAIPANEKFLDFYKVLPNTIERLSVLYKKDTNEIIKEIITSFYDSLEFRIISKFSEDGELPLGYASTCLEGIKELILYSACAEQNKSPVCLRTTNNSKEFLDSFKLGQTEKGSFVINIDIKVVDEENEQMSLNECNLDSSIEHKIVRRIGNAINQVNDIVENKIDIDGLIVNAYMTGITANMCDALLKLKPEESDVEIDTKIRYASAITKEAGIVERVNIKRNHFFILNEISKRYKMIDETKDILIDGYIKTLKKEGIDKERYKREISILTCFDNKFRTIKVELCEEDYKYACDAHRDGIKIEVKGTLDMSKKTWHLKNITRFKLIEG